MSTWLAETIGIALLFLAGTSAAAGEQVPVAVMEFTSRGGITQDQMDSLSDLLATEIRSLGPFKVVARDDIRAMLKLEEQREKLKSCDDTGCLSEIGGALGIRWLVVGNVSRLGDTFLLNLKLIDVVNVVVPGSVSRSVPGGQEALIDETRAAAREMLEKAAAAMGVALKLPEKTTTRWFEFEAHACLFGGMGRGQQTSLGKDSLGDMTGSRLGGGVLVGARLKELHSIFLNVDYLVEHWRGIDRRSLPTQVDIDFSAVRLAAAYRFAYPLLPWLAPLAEVRLGVHLYLPKKLNLAANPPGLQESEYQPKGGGRFAAMLALGLRLTFFEQMIVSAYYLWDVPISGTSSNSIVVGAGAQF